MGGLLDERPARESGERCKLSSISGAPTTTCILDALRAPKTRLVAATVVWFLFQDSTRILMLCQSWILGGYSSQRPLATPMANNTRKHRRTIKRFDAATNIQHADVYKRW